MKVYGLLQTIIVLVGFCVLLGFLVSYLLTKRTIVNSLRVLTKGIQDMSKGDFSNTIQIKTTDEIGQMGADLNAMSEQLSKMIGISMETAEQVWSGMEEIARGNQDLSSRSQEQAATLQEISSTIEEITTAIQQTAVNSEQARELSSSTLEVVERERSIDP